MFWFLPEWPVLYNNMIRVHTTMAGFVVGRVVVDDLSVFAIKRVDLSAKKFYVFSIL